jgi:hypothetical protein
MISEVVRPIPLIAVSFAGGALIHQADNTWITLRCGN